MVVSHFLNRFSALIIWYVNSTASLTYKRKCISTVRRKSCRSLAPQHHLKIRILFLSFLLWFPVEIGPNLKTTCCSHSSLSITTAFSSSPCATAIVRKLPVDNFDEHKRTNSYFCWFISIPIFSSPSYDITHMFWTSAHFQDIMCKSLGEITFLTSFFHVQQFSVLEINRSHLLFLPMYSIG